MLSGVVVITSKDSVQHQGVSLTMEGTVNLQLSAKSVGVFEAFYNSVKVRASAALLLCTALLPWAHCCRGRTVAVGALCRRMLCICRMPW